MYAACVQEHALVPRHVHVPPTPQGKMPALLQPAALHRQAPCALPAASASLTQAISPIHLQYSVFFPYGQLGRADRHRAGCPCISIRLQVTLPSPLVTVTVLPPGRQAALLLRRSSTGLGTPPRWADVLLPTDAMFFAGSVFQCRSAVSFRSFLHLILLCTMLHRYAAVLGRLKGLLQTMPTGAQE